VGKVQKIAIMKRDVEPDERSLLRKLFSLLGLNSTTTILALAENMASGLIMAVGEDMISWK